MAATAMARPTRNTTTRTSRTTAWTSRTSTDTGRPSSNPLRCPRLLGLVLLALVGALAASRADAKLMFKATSRKLVQPTISSIRKVSNLAQEIKFMQKKDEYEHKYGHVRVVEVWHGTRKANLNSIVTNNFDVNRHGQNWGHRFGAGVSFSAFASYASNYGDIQSDSRCMILCEVLVSNIVEVPENKNRRITPQPPPYIEGRYPLIRYDTTAKNKTTMDVIVKYEPNTFRPTYIVYYDLNKQENSVNVEVPRPLPLRDSTNFPPFPAQSASRVTPTSPARSAPPPWYSQTHTVQRGMDQPRMVVSHQERYSTYYSPPTPTVPPKNDGLCMIL